MYVEPYVPNGVKFDCPPAPKLFAPFCTLATAFGATPTGPNAPTPMKYDPEYPGTILLSESFNPNVNQSRGVLIVAVSLGPSEL
jgi:hypothetical protein